MGTLAAAYTFTWLDWGVVIAYFVFTTVLGAKLSGKQATIRDFFLGGRRLPWWAVSGSIIATEISAVSFVGVPAFIFAAQGNFTYLQFAVGAILARILIAWWFVPAFYEREIYSPYDYMERRLGPRVKQVVTGLFIVGQLLAQGVRVYLTAVVLQVVTDGRLSLDVSIWIIGAIAIVWTIMGGITTVIWTDVIMFACFLAGAVIALIFVAAHVPGGFGEMASIAGAAGKFTFFNFKPDLTLEFTFWAAVFANTWGCLNAYGTDQLIAQRMFCCRDVKPARWAMVVSGASQLVTLTLLVVGVGLYAYYRQATRETLDKQAVADASARAQRERLRELEAKPRLSEKEVAEVHAMVIDRGFAPEDAQLMKKNRNRVFPIFIVRVIPPGLTGLIVAAIFAAAISSLDSIMAALAQTFISAFYMPWRRRRLAREGTAPDPQAEEARQIRLSRVLIVVAGVALCAMAYVGILAERRWPDILNLALSMAGYTGGALLGAWMLAFLRMPVDDRGIIWSAPLSVIAVFGLAWKPLWATHVCLAASAVLLGLWVWNAWGDRERWRKTVLLALGIDAALALHFHVGVAKAGQIYLAPLAWPWWVPIGSIIAFVWGWLLAESSVRIPGQNPTVGPEDLKLAARPKT
jgi:Na+/proline symporter